jgi:hypothetical protein
MLKNKTRTVYNLRHIIMFFMFMALSGEGTNIRKNLKDVISH